jgi:hypothetical protein
VQETLKAKFELVCNIFTTWGGKRKIVFKDGKERSCSLPGVVGFIPACGRFCDGLK